MEGAGDYSPLDRSRILTSGGRTSDNMAAAGYPEVSGGAGGHTPSVNDLTGRASTPTTLTTLTAQYHSRYIPSAVPGSNFALMNSFLTAGSPNADARKTLLPDLQHYWSVHAESFPRYLMARGLYPPYPPLFSAGPESLSLLGPGVACVPGTAGGSGPSSSLTGQHYQRLLEMQNEAFLASVTATASHHHQALYGMGPNSIPPPFLEQASSSSHTSTPLSLVKQEPKESPCSDKATRPSERRSSGFKLDLERASSTGKAKDGHFLPAGHQDGGGSYREQKSIVTSLMSTGTPGKAVDKRNYGSSSIYGSNLINVLGNNSNGSDQNKESQSLKKAPSSLSSTSGEIGASRKYHVQMPRKSSSPTSNKDFVSRTNNPHPHIVVAGNKPPPKSSYPRHLKTPASASSSPLHSKESPPPPSSDSSLIISIPTSISAPIPLASVQHDGVLLSALASPSSAAASSATAGTKSVPPTKNAEQTPHCSVGRNGAQNASPKTDNPGHMVHKSHPDDESRVESEPDGELRTRMSGSNCGQVLTSENLDVIVDSTDDAESSTYRVRGTKCDRDRAIAETIERVATAVSDNDDVEEDDDEFGDGDRINKDHVTFPSSTQIVVSCDPDDSNLSARQESSSASRTINSKNQPVSLASSSTGNIPVGIAVAQIRPQHIHHCKGKDDSSPSVSATELRVPRVDENETAINTAQISSSGESAGPSLSAAHPETDVTSIVSEPSNSLAGRHVVNPSLWLQQLSFPLQTAGAAYNPIKYPISAPSGFKFAHDSLTGQFFLIATGETARAPYQSNLNPSAVPLDEHRRRERQSSRPAMGRNVPPEQPTSDKSVSGRTISTLGKDGTKQQAIAQPFTTSNVNNNTSNNSSSQVQPPCTTSSSSSLTPHQHLLNAVSLAYHPVKTEKKTTQSRGCSPIIFDSNGKFLPSQSLSATFKKPQTSSVAVQTCNNLLDPNAYNETSRGAQFSLRDQSNQTKSKAESSHSLSALNPLSVHCPDIDPIPHNVKSSSERLGYNPFTDPQILQAADGLELLSTLAEKRPKCSSYDDPKRIFPSPSDSCKSDTTSGLAPEETLSPADGEMKSGQCTPRRDMRRDLSPKWTIPKKEPSTSSFGDFKTPTGLEIVDPVEVRERLAEVQRRYKEKQKELAKLESKKSDESKPSKRGPGRPPKKKAVLPTRKSDDESSSSSSKAKDTHPHKKKRPAEEMVDRVFRKLPPVKPAKTSRSIHYVKSKTGPFFKRKPASSSSKRNRDLFGFDDKSWLGLHEGKKKKYSDEKSSKGKKKENPPKASTSSMWEKDKSTEDSKKTIFPNVQGRKIQETKEKRGRPAKSRGAKSDKESTKSVSIVTVKSEPNLIQSDVTLGRVGKLSFTSSQPSTVLMSHPTTSMSSPSSNTSMSSAVTSTTIITTTATISSTITTSSISSPPSTNGCCLFTSTNSTVTFGSMSSIMGGSELNFSTTSSSTTTTTSAATSVTNRSSNISSRPLITTPATSLSASAASMPSLFSFEDSSFLGCDSFGQGTKRKAEEDSDTDTSETSPNKKRKPGRPRKINPDKSAGGTETIWAKKSNSMSLLQIPDASASSQKDEEENTMQMDSDSSVMKPLFLDEEWCRRRSERIFLSEPSPQPSPSPRAEPVWKLSNFMPKNTKMFMDFMKENKENEKENPPSDSATDKEKESSEVTTSSPDKKASNVEQTPPSSTSPGTKGKKGKGKGKVSDKESPSPKSSPYADSSTPSPTPSMKKAKRAQEHTKMKHQTAKSLHDLTQKVKKKYSKGSSKKSGDEKKSSKKKSKKRMLSSDSDDDFSGSRNRPLTPEPRSAVIELNDLKDGLKVLYLNDGLFYEGTVKAIQPPDVYGILTAGQRGTRPHILCLEEMLRDAVMDVKPGSIRYLPEGARLCAFWSQQFSCLYPGTVAKMSPNPHDTNSINVEFDDGDSGRIPVDHVRLLPPDFPIIEYEPDPLENLPKRRKKPTVPPKSSNPDTKSSKKNDSSKDEEDENEDEEKEKSEDDSEETDSDDSDYSLIWKWVGTGTKRPGLKGRAKKEFYKGITRGRESIMVGDSAMFMSTARVECPYIGRIESLWESWGGQKMVRVSWYYHPDETKGGNRLADTKNALFESPHGDENDVQTISQKCEVLSHAAYKRRVNEANRNGESLEPNVYYLGGYYDPTIALVKFEPGVL